MDIEKQLNLILDVIKERNINLQVVLVLSSSCEKEENLHILEIFEKYYGNGVNGIYFTKDKMDNLVDYMCGFIWRVFYFYIYSL